MKPFFFFIAFLFSFSSLAQIDSTESIIVECELDNTGIDSVHLQTIEDMFLLDPEDLEKQFLFMIQSNKFDGELIKEFTRLSILNDSNIELILDQITTYKYNVNALRQYEIINYPILDLIGQDEVVRKKLQDFLFHADYLMDCEIIENMNSKERTKYLSLSWDEIIALAIIQERTFPLYQKDNCKVVNLNKIRQAGYKVSNGN